MAHKAKAFVTAIVQYRGVTLVHDRDNLLADGKVHAYIGPALRPDAEYIGIYKKYLNPANGR